MLASRYFHQGLLDGQEEQFPAVLFKLACWKYLEGLLKAGKLLFFIIYI